MDLKPLTTAIICSSNRVIYIRTRPVEHTLLLVIHFSAPHFEMKMVQ